MTPSSALVSAVNRSLADPSFRDLIREMHAAQRPLIEMVVDLGLDADMTDEIREILQSLPDETVEEIRRATLEMLDRGEETMPVDCQVSDLDVSAGVPVDVDVADEASGSVIRVTRAT
jgi:hypothetical protein